MQRGARVARGEEVGSEFSALLMGALWSGANGAFGSTAAQSLPRTAQGSRDASGTGSQPSLGDEAPRSPTARARIELATGTRVGPSAAADMTQSVGQARPEHASGRRVLASEPTVASGPRDVTRLAASMRPTPGATQIGATPTSHSSTFRGATTAVGSGLAGASTSRATAALQLAPVSPSVAAGAVRMSAVRPAATAASAPGATPGVAIGPTASGKDARASRAGHAATGTSTLNQGESAELLSSVERGFAALLSRQGGKVTLRLAPESLGQMTIQLDVKQGVVKADFAVEHRAAREELNRAMPMLRASLEARGLSVARLDVRTMGSAEGPGHSSDASALQAASRGASMVALVRPSMGESMREGATESHVSAEDPRHPSELRRARGSRMLHDAVDLVA